MKFMAAISRTENTKEGQKPYVNFETQFCTSRQYGEIQSFNGEIIDAYNASPLKKVLNSELQYNNIKTNLPVTNHSHKKQSSVDLFNINT